MASILVAFAFPLATASLLGRLDRSIPVVRSRSMSITQSVTLAISIAAPASAEVLEASTWGLSNGKAWQFVCRRT